ncbi:YciI family protein [Humitalea sp. 24SJ18S-53]|uniref:YciI family protein n=1 Tax=Humitalea sp. 24SJ18S-53 TaxID=3422307 RepID=UPI003D6720CF
MLFAIQCTDRPAALDVRMAARPAHVAWLEAAAAQLVFVGPVLGPDGNPCGSILIIEAESLEAARNFAAGDPYAAAGLFESTVVRGFRSVFRDGAKV